MEVNNSSGSTSLEFVNHTLGPLDVGIADRGDLGPVAIDGSYVDYEDMLLAFGSTWFWDWLWLWFMTPFSFLSFVTNSLSCFIFFQSQFLNFKLYSYLRALTLNSAVLCFFVIYDFSFYSRRYLFFVNSYWSNFYECFIHEPITSTAYFFGSVLDLLITVDRLATFSKRFRFVPESLAPWKLIAATLLVCCLLNGPYYLVLRPISFNFLIESTNQTVKLYTIDQSEFSMTLVGRVLTFGVYFLRDFLTMALSIGLNILSIVYLKRYTSRHSNLTAGVKRAREFETSMGGPSPATFTKSNPSAVTKNRRKARALASSSTSVDRKASVMVMSMCLLQIIEHMVVILAILYGNFNDNFTAQVLSRLSDLVVIVKNALNFPIFLLFNRNFQVYFTERLNPFR